MDKITETSASTVLLQLVGPEIMERISSALGGETIYIPRRPLQDGRDDLIKGEFHKLLSNGGTCMSSYRQLGKKYSISPRRVMEIVNH